ncbi:transcriptional regulator, TetR family protein [Plesiocystis pacifica SIR-1]|uniref:Transcriptional regulator, TetR family protein n=1 Tax=Plesiocystis pacifica SIR-1 TaxID=391625 RepID=A6FX10_9BACT|nr:TetR family transcriptional regulator [Plesiocystis pacifica]EDM81834.1 transcriptional regulator, TetR family protein [Plesiocystis pacifica SIR-1]
MERQQVIAQATANYWREGLHALSLNELCRRVGTSKPALYREFGGEDGLMLAALEHYRGLAVVPLLAIIASDEPFAVVLERAVAVMTSDHGTPPGCLFTKMRLSKGRLGPQTLGRLEGIEAERIAAFEAWYRRALERGEADASVAPELAAAYLDKQFTMALVSMALGESVEQIRAQGRLAMRALVAR